MKNLLTGDYQLNRDKFKAELLDILNKSSAESFWRERILHEDQDYSFADGIVLFGAGELGRKTVLGLRKFGIEPLAFSDNNPSLWGSVIEGVPVLSPMAASKFYSKTALFVVTIWRAGSSHRMAVTFSQLHALECKKVIPFALLFWNFADIFLPYYLFDLPSRLNEQKEFILQAFDLFHDEASCLEYLSQLRFRFLLDFDGLSSPEPGQQYFPYNLFTVVTDENFVDCGAFDGDSLRDLLLRQPGFCGTARELEPDPVNLKALRSFLSGLPQKMQDKVTILPVAAGRRKETLRFAAKGSASSVLDPEGVLEVDCLPLDEILKDSRPTFIKMDIEGAELDALEGARNTIIRNQPVLAISAYHTPDHLWRIPLLIREMSDKYRIFLRPHNEEGWDLVCYAVPAERLKSVAIVE